MPQRPDVISEDSIMPQVDERHGVVKTPTAEEEAETKRQKQEAYAFLTDQLSQQPDITDVVVEQPLESG